LKPEVIEAQQRQRHLEREQGAVEWEGKATVTFSDAITAVR